MVTLGILPVSQWPPCVWVAAGGYAVLALGYARLWSRQRQSIHDLRVVIGTVQRQGNLIMPLMRDVARLADQVRGLTAEVRGGGPLSTAGAALVVEKINELARGLREVSHETDRLWDAIRTPRAGDGEILHSIRAADGTC